ncbi:zinc finger MYM-type protein 1-like isoform X3 [Haemaphysalis longicornis]
MPTCVRCGQRQLTALLFDPSPHAMPGSQRKISGFFLPAPKRACLGSRDCQDISSERPGLQCHRAEQGTGHDEIGPSRTDNTNAVVAQPLPDDSARPPDLSPLSTDCSAAQTSRPASRTEEATSSDEMSNLQSLAFKNSRESSSEDESALNDHPSLPAKNYRFPKNQGGRSCQRGWFERFSWLSYQSKSDLVFCQECRRHFKKKGDNTRNVERAFVKTGFNNWKKAIERFKSHEKSQFHVDSVSLNLSYQRGIPVLSLLSQQCNKHQEDARAVLRVIVSSVRYLCRTGQALRGQGKLDGNFLDLLHERSEDVPVLKTWMAKRDKWVSGDVQNELIEIMAHTVQREIVEDVKSSPFYGIIADGTTDVNGDEQFTFCVRWVQSKTLELREEYIGMYNAPDSRAETLYSAIKDMLLRLGLDFHCVRGHCFDGAANMSGRFSGVQKRISDCEPRSLYVHCSNHCLDLVLQEASRSCDIIGDALSTVKDISNVILDSKKRKSAYANIVVSTGGEVDLENGSRPNNLLPLCPTRWTVRVKSMQRFLDNYARVQETLKELLETPGSVTDGSKAIFRGYYTLLQKFETLLGINISIAFFGPCEELARAFQSSTCRAAGAKEAAEALREAISQLRSDAAFEELWQHTSTTAARLCLKEPRVSRPAKPPRRYEATDRPVQPVTLDVKAALRKEYFAAADRIMNETQRRFEQPGMLQLVKLEGILASAAKGTQFTADGLKASLGVHAVDFDLCRLSAQFLLLPTLLHDADSTTSLGILKMLQSKPENIRELMDQVVRYVQLLLSIPASVASGERSFSALRRVKTYLRNRMTQKRLSHLLILNIHKERTAALRLEDIIKEFVSRTAERVATFGPV